MVHRWIEDDPLDAGTSLSIIGPGVSAPSPGLSVVVGLGAVVSSLLMLLSAVALVD